MTWNFVDLLLILLVLLNVLWGWYLVHWRWQCLCPKGYAPLLARAG